MEGKGIFAHKVLIQTQGYARHAANAEKRPLWQYDRAPTMQQAQTLTFIPWFSWANRWGRCASGWMRRKKKTIKAALVPEGRLLKNQNFQERPVISAKLSSRSIIGLFFTSSGSTI